MPFQVAGEGLFPLFVFVIEPLAFDGGAQLWLVPGGYMGFSIMTNVPLLEEFL